MCHFLPAYHLGIVFLGRVEGQNITTALSKRIFSCGQIYASWTFEEQSETFAKCKLYIFNVNIFFSLIFKYLKPVRVYCQIGWYITMINVSLFQLSYTILTSIYFSSFDIPRFYIYIYIYIYYIYIYIYIYIFVKANVSLICLMWKLNVVQI